MCSQAVALAACVPARGGWDHRALERSHEALREGGHRLRDLAPHFAPVPSRAAGLAPRELVLFLCRWDTERTIPVAFPEDADEAERALIERALEAWEGAGLGLRFGEVAEAPTGIEIRFVSPGDPGPVPKGAGDTLADCALGPGLATDERVDAGMRHASILLNRAAVDLVGRALPLGEAERVGAAVHEIGHALGFASHAAAGDSVMRASPEVARRIGREVLAGEWTGDANLRALYAVPTGTIVGRLALPAAASQQLGDFLAAARAADLKGPFTRVGDRSARYFLRGARRVPIAVSVRPWPAARPEEIEFVPNPPAELMLLGAAERRAR